MILDLYSPDSALPEDLTADKRAVILSFLQSLPGLLPPLIVFLVNAVVPSFMQFAINGA